MGWEIIHSEKQNYAAFICNTTDVAFGPIYYTHGEDFDIGNFYKWWEKSVVADPRTMEHHEISENMRVWSWLQKNPLITVYYTTASGEKFVLNGDFEIDFGVSLPVYNDAFSEDDIDFLESLVDDLKSDIMSGTYAGQCPRCRWAITGLYGVKQPIKSAIRALGDGKIPESNTVSDDAYDLCLTHA